MSDEILKLRKEYQKAALDESHTHADPFEQFNHWFAEALNAGLDEPNAFVLSTADKDGHPSARIVLLRDATDRGFTFFTNYKSRKGREISENPAACFTFFWHALERQVRLEGKLEKLPESDSDSYFSIRPKGSQIGAWASPQSEQIASRAELETREEKYQTQFGDAPIPRPPHWGGYILIPDYLEFWQGRENRLHDRICYELSGSEWKRFRLAP